MCRYVACGARHVVKACSNEANIVQQCWTKVLRRFRLKPTLSNIIQRGVQTTPTCWTNISASFEQALSQHHPTSSNIIQHHPTLSKIIQRGVQTTPTCWTNISASFEQALSQHHPTLSNIIQRGVQTTPTCWTNISASFEQALSQHHAIWYSNEASMLHSTMLHDAEPTCWLRLNTPALSGGL